MVTTKIGLLLDKATTYFTAVDRSDFIYAEPDIEHESHRPFSTNADQQSGCGSSLYSRGSIVQCRGVEPAIINAACLSAYEYHFTGREQLRNLDSLVLASTNHAAIIAAALHLRWCNRLPDLEIDLWNQRYWAMLNVHTWYMLPSGRQPNAALVFCF